MRKIIDYIVWRMYSMYVKHRDPAPMSGAIQLCSADNLAILPVLGNPRLADVLGHIRARTHTP
ncbi:hypothetical protein HQ47_03620 [Porphyromonas macacae]|uniref:Uncharacterized protein n=1 Tax=Porphyromonas macacae TaxID=28115 RepID=A0A0A2E7Y4_9PORP|nr:hypothetical protein HQ47_03620 [Porphyromonas macacae]